MTLWGHGQGVHKSGGIGRSASEQEPEEGLQPGVPFVDMPQDLPLTTERTGVGGVCGLHQVHAHAHGSMEEPPTNVPWPTGDQSGPQTGPPGFADVCKGSSMQASPTLTPPHLRASSFRRDHFWGCERRLVLMPHSVIGLGHDFYGVNICPLELDSNPPFISCTRDQPLGLTSSLAW